MGDKRVQRRLAAILAADVVGYSRLIETDEEGTRARLRSLQADVFGPQIAADGGRIVKTMGDGVLVEFPSAVDAVRHALKVFGAVRERNADVPEEDRIEFRVGINVGDVIVEGDDIHGDGVNIAARLQALCDPGEVYVSGTVYDQAAGKLAASFEELGEKRVKNIKRPIRTYRVLTKRRGAAGAGADHNQPALELPNKPSIAVLPFEDMSAEKNQEYFANGIAEDIITGLSRNRGVFVIARNSSFTYKGAAVDVKRVARELGVRYVLEGSVRRAGSRVRITAQLVDAVTSKYVWTERFDRELEDIFAVQDEITQNIVAALGPELASAEVQRARRKDPSSLDAWECTMRATWHFARVTREDMEEARRLALRAIELDPGAAPAFRILAMTHVRDAVNGWSDSAQQSILTAYEAAWKAVALDDRDANAQSALGMANLLLRKFEDAFSRFEMAIDLDPNSAAAHGGFGIALAMAGRRDEAAEMIATAIRLSPRDPFKYVWLAWRGEADFVEERYDEAADWARKSLQINPDFPSGLRLLAASYGQMGRINEARTALERLLRLVPGQTAETIRSRFPFRRPENMERYLDGLHKAGLPK
jgi:adenylate cyclase